MAFWGFIEGSKRISDSARRSVGANDYLTPLDTSMVNGFTRLATLGRDQARNTKVLYNRNCEVRPMLDQDGDQ